jgi:hypothetical protein
MSDTQAEPTPGTDRPAGSRGTRAASRPTGWVGWVVFAGVVMITLGAFHVIDGLVALFEKGYYQVNSSHLVVHVNYSAWGGAHLALGALFILVGFGVLVGQTWARVVGIALAVISAVINLAFLAAYPVWGVILIALDVVVIYALAMHGGEVKEV